MRIIRYTIIGLVITAVLFKVYKVYLEDVFHLLVYSASGKIRDVDMDDIRVNKAYIFDKSKWMLFPIDSTVTRIRIVTNANLEPTVKSAYDDEWNYQIQYQILDNNKNILIDRTYYQNTRTAKYMDHRLNKEIVPAFYLNDSLVPAVSRMISLDLDCFDGNKTSIRVRLLYKDDQVSNVIMRLYFNDNISLAKAGNLWSRLSRNQKERMSRGNVFAHELLSKQEKLNILMNNWHPVGPLGVVGKDYQEKNLYVLNKIEGEEVGVDIIPAGLFIKRGHRGVLPVPEQGGKVLIKFINPSGATLPEGEEEITVRWYGRGIHDRSEKNLTWKGEDFEIKGFYEEGILEISTLHDLVVRSFMVHESEKFEITPEPVSVRAYVAQHDSPVEYDIHHSGKADTPFKVALRYIIREDMDNVDTNPESIECQLIDKSGKVLRKERLGMEGVVSLYDKVFVNNTELDISEPVFYYFSLPEDVSVIRFETDVPVLVSGYTRPENLIVETRVPESYNAYTPRRERRPVWFTVRPGDYERYLDGEQSFLLVVQTRPPEDDEDILKGLYVWEAYRPQGKWLGNYVLIQREGDTPVREHASVSAYKLLVPDQDMKVVFASVDNSKGIEPTLIFAENDQGPFSIKLFLDRQLIYHGEFTGSTGEIILPFVTYGTHELRVESTGKARLFLNCIENTRDIYIKRMIYKIGKNELSFIYNKETVESELLSAVFYAPDGNRQNSVLHADIILPEAKNSGPVMSRTFLKRKYTIRADNVGKMPVLNTPGKYVDGGQLFFLTLGDDLPLGEYPVTFTMKNGSEGYLILYKVTPGSFDYRKFFIREGM